jgi:DNA ligase D-like protein (predicted 3'-phosphoesterase)
MPPDYPSFVIQKHAASSLHYDFRLEVDGVLRSWAVPKGPSTDPGEKRLAIEVDDHPLAWGSFEGVIRAGYGKGRVIIWDRGRFRNLNDELSMAEALERGRASFWLEGEKLRGGWALTRMRDGQWLLVKRRDEHADSSRNPVEDEPKSVQSGRTIDDLGQ